MKFWSISPSLIQTTTAITLGILPFQHSASAASSFAISEDKQYSSRPQLLVENIDKVTIWAKTSKTNQLITDLKSNSVPAEKPSTFSGNERLNQLNNLASQSTPTLVVLEPSPSPSESTDIGISSPEDLDTSPSSGIYIPVETSEFNDSTSLPIPIQVEENYTEETEVSVNTESDISTISNGIPINVNPVDNQNVTNLSDLAQKNYSAKVDVDKPILINTLTETATTSESQEFVSTLRQTTNPSKQGNYPSVGLKSDETQPNSMVSSIPIQVDYYNPTIIPSAGDMVSPSLPQLYSPDQYLPEGDRSSKGYMWPAKGVLTSGYGWRWGRMHKGIDIAAPVGTPIVAVADGEVISAGWNSGGYGNLVKLKHDDGSITLYAHNSKILVRRGQKVRQGQQIAKMGSTGFSTGPHLHFEIHPRGSKAANPIAFLPGK